MTLPSDTTLALISWLASIDTPQLQTLIKRRRIAHSACTSFRTLAEELLSAENIRESLRELPRAHLLALATPEGAEPESLRALEAAAFLSSTPGGHSYLVPRSALSALDTLDDRASEPRHTPAADLSEGDRGAGASTGLTLVVSVSDLLDAVANARFPVGAEGKPTATSLKSLHAELGAGYDIAVLWDIATEAGLLGTNGSAAALTTQALTWRDLSDSARYALLAQSWWARVPSWLAATMTAHPDMSWDSTLIDHVRYHYPLVDPDSGIQSLRADAELLGIIRQSIPTPWAQALWRGEDVARSFAASSPAYAPGVFAHDDYTLLATGPLAPDHRSVLASITARELGGLVPRYRMTSSSVLNALQDGVSPESVPELLREVCVNDVPASMIALADDVARRALDLEVHSHGESTTLVTRRDTLSEELISDPGLIVLGLKRTGDCELTCSWPAERVHSTLLAASYPSLLVDSEGAPVVGEITLAENSSSRREESQHSAIAELVRAAEESAAQGVPAGFHSIIEVATETKTPLEIVVTMPDGTSATVVMEPRALSAGRLRGVELKHVVEKTFPVSHITSLRAWTGDAD